MPPFTGVSFQLPNQVTAVPVNTMPLSYVNGQTLAGSFDVNALPSGVAVGNSLGKNINDALDQITPVSLAKKGAAIAQANAATELTPLQTQLTEAQLGGQIANAPLVNAQQRGQSILGVATINSFLPEGYRITPQPLANVNLGNNSGASPQAQTQQDQSLPVSNPQAAPVVSMPTLNGIPQYFNKPTTDGKFETIVNPAYQKLSEEQATAGIEATKELGKNVMAGETYKNLQNIQGAMAIIHNTMGNLPRDQNANPSNAQSVALVENAIKVLNPNFQGGRSMASAQFILDHVPSLGSKVSNFAKKWADGSDFLLDRATANDLYNTAQNAFQAQAQNVNSQLDFARSQVPANSGLKPDQINGFIPKVNMASQVNVQAGNSNLPTVTPQDYAKLAPGSFFRDINGTPRQKPYGQ